MVDIISRAPHDSFTYELFNELIRDLSCEYQAYYIWSNPPDKLRKFLSNTKFSKPNIIIGIKDLLDLWEEYNWWHDTAQQGIKLLDALASQHPDKNFIIFTSLENIELESKAPNIQYITWGGDIVNQADNYQTVVPVLDKNLNSDRTYISLNRNRRPHRLVTLSYLFGKEHDRAGHITYLGQQIDVQNFDNLLDCLSWEFEGRHDNARTAMLNGYSKFYNNKSLLTDDYQIYDRANDNVTNFNQRLRSKYQNSFVEIVSESSFSAPSYMLTEKTLNSMYGCNFPIILSGVGAVAHLREIGFDLFDDIIDHTYDTIANPFDRIISAIDDNQRLLLDSSHAKTNWKNNQNRFEYNINLAKTKLYPWYCQRTIDQFNKVKWL